MIRAGSVYIATNAGINAVGTGYTGGQGLNTPTSGGEGPGGGWYHSNGAGAGGAHGGIGGTCRYGGLESTTTYGDSNAPVHPGSGGGMGYNTYVGGNGGGVVRIETDGRIRCDGTINARGQHDPPGQEHAGGGGGGSIYLRCKAFAGGASAALIADGGNCGTTLGQQGGAGGGGRIAVWYTYFGYSGTASATNGLGGSNSPGETAEPGTVVWVLIPPRGSVFMVR